jgi:hypothetical protein
MLSIVARVAMDADFAGAGVGFPEPLEVSL